MSNFNSLTDTFNKVIDDFISKLNVSRGENRNSKIPNSGISLGLNLKDIRAYAKNNLDLFDDILECPDNLYYDLDILKVQSILVNDELSLDDKLSLIDKLSYKIKNFGVCDNLGHGIKIREEDSKKLFDYASEIALSDKEFRARLGIIIIVSNFVNEENIDSIFSLVSKIKSNKEYTVKAAASLINSCASIDEEKTVKFLKCTLKNKGILKHVIKKSNIKNLRKNLKITNNECK